VAGQIDARQEHAAGVPLQWIGFWHDRTHKDSQKWQSGTAGR
jgi:hypothetical protein